MDKICVLEVLLKKKDEQIVDLENRLHDVEQYSRKDDIIITGLEIKHKTYARVVETNMKNFTAEVDENAPDVEKKTLENQVINFLNDNGLDMNENEISACHNLNKKKKIPDIILRFVSRKTKVILLKNGKKLKGTNVYMNDHLTSRNAETASLARQMKREKKIETTWVRNCNVFIKTKGDEKIKIIRDKSELSQFN